MKVIFLDIDGVLNNFRIEHDHTRQPIDKECMKHLNQIIEKTGAKVVLSSTWRVNFNTVEEFQAFMVVHGFNGTCIGFTPWLKQPYMVRGNEIYAWIDQNEKLLNCKSWDFTDYVILDDDGDMLLWQKSNFVQTKTAVGLTECKAFEAIAILNKETSNGRK